MKTGIQTAKRIRTDNRAEFSCPRPARPHSWTAALLGVAAAGHLLAAQAAPGGTGTPSPVGAVFVIAMENHNFTQPNPTSSPQQILGNPAAPFLNSLITPGDWNAAQVSCAAAYYNASVGVHPSEANYVWAEAGTDFGVHTDADPRDANGNAFYDRSVHLTAQLDAAGISWRNYQEDVELSSSPTVSASGTDAPVLNPCYGTAQYNYAAKHNPMAFFTDTSRRNVYPLDRLLVDLSKNTVARYNWITPNQYNDAHTPLNGGFTYQGVHYTGDQAAVAQGDNFLAQIIPRIMASPAYQNDGIIIIWWDESEGGDDTDHTVPEIIISPLARGNAYASPVPMNHSSDIKTMEEIFGLPALNNLIPAEEISIPDGGYSNVATVNDLSDLFVPGVIPSPASVSVTRSRFLRHRHARHVLQVVSIRNTGVTPVAAPLFLVLDHLSPDATLLNSDGATAVLAPLGGPYVRVRVGGGDFRHRHQTRRRHGSTREVLGPGKSATVILEFLARRGGSIEYDTRVLSVTPAP